MSFFVFVFSHVGSPCNDRLFEGMEWDEGQDEFWEDEEDFSDDDFDDDDLIALVQRL